MKTITDINKFIIDVDKAITLTCLKFDIKLLLYDVEIRNIPIKGTNNRSVSNMCEHFN